MSDLAAEVIELRNAIKKLQGELTAGREENTGIAVDCLEQKKDIDKLKSRINQATYIAAALGLAAVPLGFSFTNISSNVAIVRERVDQAKTLSESNNAALRSNSTAIQESGEALATLSGKVDVTAKQTDVLLQQIQLWQTIIKEQNSAAKEKLEGSIENFKSILPEIKNNLIEDAATSAKKSTEETVVNVLTPWKGQNPSGLLSRMGGFDQQMLTVQDTVKTLQVSVRSLESSTRDLQQLRNRVDTLDRAVWFTFQQVGQSNCPIGFRNAGNLWWGVSDNRGPNAFQASAGGRIPGTDPPYFVVTPFLCVR